MGVFVKLAGLAVVIAGGSLLVLWLLAGGDVALAWLALAGTAAMTAAVIRLIVRDTHSTRAP